MKMSIAWIFDYIDADWKSVHINDLVTKFNQATAEVESFEKVTLDLDTIALAEVRSVAGSIVILHCPEWDQDIELPMRNGIKERAWYLIKKDDVGFAWATGFDFFCYKDHALPEMWCEENLRAGYWKKYVEVEDYILEVDNKSITHRPDMWGHYGFAREIAALLELPLKPLEQFLVKKTIREFGDQDSAADASAFTIRNDAPEVCKRFAGLSIESIEHRAALLPMALRLLRVDSKPIDALVDFTNYVMLELGQPMHAFDADKVKTNLIVPRMAYNGEKLTLLDEQEVSLTTSDLVITDGEKPISLAGVMGSLHSSISTNTTSLFLESANFDATTIRRTSTRCKVRTEASARFEKTLDPNQNTDAILRFLKLLDEAEMNYKAADEIASLGLRVQPIELVVSHNFIIGRLGVEITPSFIIKTLRRIGFDAKQHDDFYTVMVPTFRSSKDVTIKEDIVEEVGRFFGYTKIPLAMPTMQLKPRNATWVYRTRKIKQLLAYTCNMRELYNYAFFDEAFLQEIKWQSKTTLEVQDPVSENWKRPVTTLMPGLLKAVQSSAAKHDSLRFFELARTWERKEGVIESKVISGIMFEQKKPVDFYSAKAELQKLFDLLKIDVTWKKVDKPKHPWSMPYQTAQLMHEGTAIGVAGKINQSFTRDLFPGNAFMFELNADYLLNYNPPVKKLNLSSKYPDATRDVSMFVPLNITVDAVLRAIKDANKKIISTDLVDFFEKESWVNKRSLTCRFVIRDCEKTMTKEEIDTIYEAVIGALKKLGAEIR